MLKIEITCPAKLNLGLAVVGKRDDGYHDLESVFVNIGLSDRLVIEESTEFSLVVHGLDSVPADKNNLVWRAAKLFTKETGKSIDYHFDIFKRIPPGGGLGGASSDAAGALLGLNKLTGQPLNGQELASLAENLGSDVPFFLDNGAALVKGRGELLTPIELKQDIYLVIAFPRAAVSTSWAYNSLSEKEFGKLDSKPIMSWLGGGKAPAELPNAFIIPVTDTFIAVEKTLNELRKTELQPVSMSGSGSTCFGVASNFEEAGRISRELELNGIAAIPTRVISQGITLRELS